MQTRRLGATRGPTDGTCGPSWCPVVSILEKTVCSHGALEHHVAQQMEHAPQAGVQSFPFWKRLNAATVPWDTVWPNRRGMLPKLASSLFHVGKDWMQPRRLGAPRGPTDGACGPSWCPVFSILEKTGCSHCALVHHDAQQMGHAAQAGVQSFPQSWRLGAPRGPTDGACRPSCCPVFSI